MLDVGSGGTGVALGADGLTFVLQNDAKGSMALRDAGGDLGYTWIDNSLIIEFDTWFNDAIAGDPDGNQVGRATSGVLGSGPTTYIGTRINDGDIFYSWIYYDGIADQLEVRLSNPTSGS